MENAGDILYVIFIIAIGLFQYWRKQKEKANNKQKPVSSAPPAEEKSFKEIFEDMMGGYEEKESAPEAYEEKYVPEIESVPQSFSTETPEEMRKKKSTGTGQKLSETKVDLEVPEDESDSLDFDLRKAIIYTAIMEPKFKNY